VNDKVDEDKVILEEFSSSSSWCSSLCSFSQEEHKDERVDEEEEVDKEEEDKEEWVDKEEVDEGCDNFSSEQSLIRSNIDSMAFSNVSTFLR
jgi:hypothetical protein